MRVARESNRQCVCRFEPSEALATLAVPRAPARGEEEEVVDAEVVADEPSVFDLLRKRADWRRHEQPVWSGEP